MEYKTYSLKPFDSNMAQRGNLCVATSYGYTGSTVNTDTAAFKGSYICTTINPQEFTVVIGGVTCTFDGSGYPKDITSKNYQLWMGSTNIQLEQYGSAIRRAKKVTTTRGVDGTVTTTEVEGESKNIMIASLTPRDNFALQALRAIIPILPDLKNIGDSERDYWCKIAYQWAATMMDNAAQVRADFEDQTEAPTTQEEEIGVLETNTDKLLNNLIVELEKTNEAEIKDEHYVYSERISIPKLMTFLAEYTKHIPEDEDDTQEFVGLDDLINAIKEINVDISTDDLVTAIQNQGKDAEHPIYISGGGFPSRQVLAAALPAESIHDLLTFNADGAVGYSTKAETKKAILGYLNNYADVAALSTAVLTNLTADAIYNKIQTNIDGRIKAWLNATTIVSDGEEGWKLNVPNNI